MSTLCTLDAFIVFSLSFIYVYVQHPVNTQFMTSSSSDNRNITKNNTTLLSQYRHRRAVNIFNSSSYQLTRNRGLHVNSFIQDEDLFYAPFGLHVKHIGYFNPTMKNYLVTLKYDFSQLKSSTWLTTLLDPVSQSQPIIKINSTNYNAYLRKFTPIIKWYANKINIPKNAPKILSISEACNYLNILYYNNTLELPTCISDFESHLKYNVFSFYTLKSILDLLNILEEETIKETMGRSMPFFDPLSSILSSESITKSNFKSFTTELLLNITLQYMQVRFAIGLHSDAIIFSSELDLILKDVNAYIPTFTTDTTLTRDRQKRFILASMFTVASGIFSAWRFYKDYQFKKNLRRTLHVILASQNVFKHGIMVNHRNLLSLADITSINFHKVQSDYIKLRHFLHKKFAVYNINLLKMRSESVNYFEYNLHYTNILHKISHDLNHFRSKIQFSKNIIYQKARSFISGLHILAESKIPETILHATTFSHILHSIKNELNNNTNYQLLYGTEVNPYYHMPIAKSFIINNVLYINIILPLQIRSTFMMNLYLLESHYIPVNMSIPKHFYGSYTKLDIAHKYMISNNNKFAFLKDNFDKQTMLHDRLYVSTVPMLLFNINNNNCFINIIGNSPANLIIKTCKFKFYNNISVSPTLITTSSHYYLMNVNSHLSVICSNNNASFEKQGYSIDIIKRTALCECTLQMNDILLIGSESKCSNSPSFSMKYTYNFVTEWFSNPDSINFYSQGFQLLKYPSKSFFPSLDFTGSKDNSIYNDNIVHSISLHQLKKLIKKLHNQNPIFLTKTDQNSYLYGNISGNDNNEQTDLISWLNPEIKSSMIFMFISGTIAIISFVLLMFLIIKHFKLNSTFLKIISSDVLQTPSKLEECCLTPSSVKNIDVSHDTFSTPTDIVQVPIIIQPESIKVPEERLYPVLT